MERRTNLINTWKTQEALCVFVIRYPDKEKRLIIYQGHKKKTTQGELSNLGFF